MPLDFVVDLRATVAPVVPHLTLVWTQRQQSIITSQKLHRRLKGAASWELQATLTNSQTSYADSTAQPGVEYEYWMERRFSGVSPNVAIGYLSAGLEVPPVEDRGTLLLVVDSSMTVPLAPEIAQLKEDLAGDGWSVQTIPVARTDAPPAVRALIQAAYNADPTRVKAVYLLGRVPVPYSGLLAPDGHVPDHLGAWPADVYYADMDGTWPDTSINNSTASGTRQDNVPGDGKFDITYLSSDAELQLGRVDLSNMSKAPTSGVSETALLRRYLRKAHDYRHRLGAYTSVPRRSLIRDNFGHAFSSEPFASSGWAAAYSCVSQSADTPSASWFNAPPANTYLFGYGCGGGGYESASGVGTSAEFGRKPSRVVFTSLFGSYHGDWDSSNNFMRSVLAGNATGDSLGLASFWAGRPNWYLHPCGMGETLGYAARLTQNNTGANYSFTGSSPHSVHIALMGDPALRLHMVQPPRNLAATSASAQVSLEWDVSTEAGVRGYHVYRAVGLTGSFVRLNAEPLTAVTYNDSSVTAGETYRYMVRTLKVEAVPGGTYLNLSQGSLVTLTANGGVPAAPQGPTSLVAQTGSSGQIVLSWTDNALDETGFRIERRTNAAGAFTSVGTVGENVATFTDPGPLVHGNVYYYQVVATGIADSLGSNVVAVDGHAGFIEVKDARVKISRSSGAAVVTVTRFGGGTGAVQVTGASNDISAVAGTHYTAVSAPVAFANGENTSNNVSITLLNSGQPQLPRMFRYAITNPTANASLAAQASTRVVIEDPTATLPTPWQQAVLGSVDDSSPAVFAEGAFGSALDGGSIGTSDNGRFVFQPRTGDGTIVAFIDTPLPLQNAARFAVMIRGSNSSGDPMAATVVAGDTVGTNLASRAASSTAAVLAPGNSNNLKAPRWVRLSRSGNVFTSETSTDGAAWTLLGSATVPMAATANWGLFHASDGGSSDFQLARFRHVAISNVGALPAPKNVVAAPQGSPARIQLSWDPIGGASGYRIERRPLHGTFALIATVNAPSVTTADASVRSGVRYEYRVQALSGATSSLWSATVSATAPGSPTAYQLWLQAHLLPMDESGQGAPTATPAGDGIANLIKFALGLSPQQPSYGVRMSTGMELDGGQSYLSLTYTRPEPAPVGVVYSVETCADLTGWNAAETLPISDTASAGERTIKVRDTVPSSGDRSRRFIRLKVTLQ